MWFEEPGMTKILFNTHTSNQEYQFTQGMWFEEPGITKVLFNIQISNKKILIYPKYVV